MEDIDSLDNRDLKAVEGQPGLGLPSAQGLILETGIESHVRLHSWSLLLPLPVSLPLSLSLMNKNKILKKNKIKAVEKISF